MSDSLESPFGDCQPDPASDIATQIMMLEWTRGASLNDHCHRYGEIQELADPIIKAAIAAAYAKGRAEGIREAVALVESQFSAPGIVGALHALLPTTGGYDAA